MSNEKIIETYINDFIVDLKKILNKLNVSGINLDNPILSDITISVTSTIEENEMKDTILENVKTTYSPYSNTIYIDESFINSPQLRYHLTKRLLECISTRKKGDILSQGISLINISNGETQKFNSSLNDAITENITNLMLFDNSLEEDTYRNHIIARKNLSKIEEIVGMETVVRSYFNSDYVDLETNFNNYTHDSKLEFKNIASKMDRLQSLKDNTNEKDNLLAYEIDRILISVYATKNINSRTYNLNDRFKEHIITGQTVRSEFGYSDKPGYKDVDRNIIYYELLTSGLKSANINKVQNEKVL